MSLKNLIAKTNHWTQTLYEVIDSRRNSQDYLGEAMTTPGVVNSVL